MPRKGFRWEHVALSAVLTLAVLSFAYYSYETIGVRTLLQKALLTDPDVSSVKVAKDGDAQVVEIALAKVADLSTTHGRLYAVVKDRLGQAAFRLRITDQRDQTLQEVYHSIHYYLEEASARGNFGTMIEACSAALARAGISDYKVTVDQEHIYVQMALGEHYLYQVLDRPPESQGGVTQ
jgi:hypothetical protein